MFKEALVSLFPAHCFSFYSHLAADVKEINKHDFLLIGGGNIVDSKFLKGISSVKIPHSFIGVGITDKNSASFLGKAQQVFVRDDRSYDLLANENIPNLYRLPDLAFSLRANKENGINFLQKIPEIDKSKKTIGVFLNDSVNTSFSGSLLKFFEVQKFILELARFLDKQPCNILFIPMSFLPPDDRRISLDVRGYMKNGYKSHCIANHIGIQECLDLTSALDFAITMRLHASIFCTIGGTPFIDITHHSKSKSYLVSEGIEDLSTDYYEISIRALEEAFSIVRNNYEDVRKRLLQISEHNQDLLGKGIESVYIP